MHKRSFGSRVIASPILPTGDQIAEYIADELMAEIAEDPAFREIAKALACARYLDLDVTDPMVLSGAIAAGRRRFSAGDFAVGYPHRRRPVRGIHPPVIYYAAMGDLVKIGTSKNIITRMGVLGQPDLLAVEYGDESDETERHALFGALRVHGEWFRREDPLCAYIDVTADAFRGDFGATLDDWIWDLKMQSRKA